MTTQQILARMSEIREQLNTDRLLEIRIGENGADALQQERQQLTAELRSLEAKYRTALASENATETSTERELTPTEREFDGLMERFDLGELFSNVIEHRVSDGVIAEIQSELGLGGNQLPVEVLMEHRAVTPAPADVGQNQSGIEGFVFPQSSAAFLGIPSPVVGVGDATFPVLTSDPGAGTPAENIAQAETTGAFTADVLTPSRIQASFLWSREDAARMAGMGEALREALSGGLSDKLDQQILAGTNGLFSGTNLDNHNVNAVTTFATYISNFAMARVDGQYANTLADLRILLGSGTFAHAGSVYRANEADRTALDRLTAITAGVRVSKHVPAVASSKQNAVIRLGMRQDMVAPVWGGVTLIPDEVTQAKKGQIVLTAVMLHAIKVIRKAGFHKQQSQHA